MPTGTAPDNATFCTLGPAATIVVSCRIGRTVDMFHSRGSTASITSPISWVPSSAASILGWMLRSQIPVMFDGAWTSCPESDAGGAVVAVAVAEAVGDGMRVRVGDGDGDDGGLGVAVDTAVASKAGQP